MPNAPITSPLDMELPDKAPTMQMPSNDSMKYSGVENRVRIGFISGTDSVSTMAPTIPPNAEQV